MEPVKQQARRRGAAGALIARARRQPPVRHKAQEILEHFEDYLPQFQEDHCRTTIRQDARA